MDIQEHSGVEKFKSSRPQVLYKKAIQKMLRLFTRKRSWWSHILVKLQAEGCN